MPYTKKFAMHKIFSIYFVWTIALVFMLMLSLRVLPLQQNYLGGGSAVYQTNPLFWGHANFDGEHYLEIARNGYRPLQYFFFPLYPILLRNVSSLFATTLHGMVGSGIAISFILTGVGISLLYKLALLENKKAAKWVIISLLLFPTSFYFQMVYTEALFFTLSVASFYFARRGKWFLAGFFGALATATRLVGIILIPALVYEWWIQKPRRYTAFYLMLIPMGFIAYVLYLQMTTGDALAFYHNVQIFGDQRSSHFILLPQVLYRYLFKILPNAFSYWPTLATTLLEFGVGILFLGVSIYSFFKQRGSYALFLIGSFLLPTLSGSFSSLPRYCLVLFPAFLLIGQFLSKRGQIFKTSYIVISLILLSIFSMLFFRGFWVS